MIDGETGLLVELENKDPIAGAIIRLLTDKDLTHRLVVGENGRRRVENELNWRTVGIKVEEILMKTVIQHTQI